MSTTADVVESTVSISLTPLMKMDGLDVYVDGEVGEANLLNDTGDLIWYLEKELGPQSQELYKAVPITVIYAAIFVTGIVGNVATCVVIARNRYMQTATNCYLFNLAVSDLLMLVAGLPQEMYISYWCAYPWPFGDVFCVLRNLAAETSTYASILTITVFTAERYVAICHPMRSQALSSLRRAVVVVVVVWVISAVCSVPMVVQFGVVYLRNEVTGDIIPESAQCNIRPERYLEHSFEVSTFLFFLTPMTVITVLYILIGVAVRRSTLSRTGSDSSTHSRTGAMAARRCISTVQSPSSRALYQRTLSVASCRPTVTRPSGTDMRALQQLGARRAVLKMLVVVVVVFFVCWAPFHTQRLLVIYLKGEDWTPAMTLVQNVLYYISGVLYYVSAVVNPILYNIMSLKFRQAFRSTIFRPCCCLCCPWSLKSKRSSLKRKQQQQQQQQQYRHQRHHQLRQTVYRFTTRKPFTEPALLTLAAQRQALNNNVTQQAVEQQGPGGFGVLTSSSHQQQQQVIRGLAYSTVATRGVRGGQVGICSEPAQRNTSSSTSHGDNLLMDLELALSVDGPCQRHWHSTCHHVCKTSPATTAEQYDRKFHSFA